ncbi:MAG: NADH-ubiquinone oxidoreductase-F iron-sulfur binding region domain-containing protein [Leptospirales bacterium]
MTKTNIYIGMATCGLASGARRVLEAVERESQEHGYDLAIHSTGCIGMCHNEPILEVEVSGQPRVTYAQVTPESVTSILESHFKKGTYFPELVYGQTAVKDSVAIDGLDRLDEADYFRKQVKIVSKRCGVIDPSSIDDYLNTGGYNALKSILAGWSPDSVIETLIQSGLRGRGGAGFPTGLKWKFTRQSQGDTKYVVCNADEGDPGAFMDRSVLEGDPHSVIEGMIIASFAIGNARQGYIYCRAEYPHAIRLLKKAIAQAMERGFLGERILGSDLSFHIEIKEGAGAYVCGEETALLASIMGDRGMPWPKPPFPAQRGIWNNPTLINNVETLANIAHILIGGAEWFSSYGTEKTKGTKTFALTGKIKRTGLIEVAAGTTLKEIVYEIAGGMSGQKKFKAAQLGGPSGGCIPVDLIDTPVDFESLISAGAIMGSGGIIVLDEANCIVDTAKYFMTFTKDESCGECTPCRDGTKVMLDMIQRISDGRGEMKDLDDLVNLSTYVKANSLCGLGQAAPNPVLSTIRYFRAEYEDHIKRKKCVSQSCKEIVYAPCQHECPVGIDIPRYITEIFRGQYAEALATIRKRLPFPGIISRTCYRPCESPCRRGDLDEPIAINGLKRFAYDWEYNQGIRPDYLPDADLDKKVAVIGAGPAGLTCAFYLGKMGYKVTVFDQLPVIGGMLAVGIPKYRLPRELLNFEMGIFNNLPVEFKTNTAMGRDFSLEDLFQEGYDAAFVGIGAHKPSKMRIPGEDLPSVQDGIVFLRKVCLDEPVHVGKRVAVIGGGNVAIDVARSAIRMGAEQVTVYYRRTREEMPAHEFEVQEAEHEGIVFEFLLAPLEIREEELPNGEKESVIDFQVNTLSREFDNSGRRKPVAVKGNINSIHVDTIVAAIGQTMDTSVFEKNGISFHKWGTVKVDPDTLMSESRPAVFAGGDAMTGPLDVIHSIRDGEQCAVFIDRYFKGNPDRTYPFYSPPILEDPMDLGDMHRIPMPAIPIEARTGFSEVETGFNVQEAWKEASRCIRCELEGRMDPSEKINKSEDHMSPVFIHFDTITVH